MLMGKDTKSLPYEMRTGLLIIQLSAWLPKRNTSFKNFPFKYRSYPHHGLLPLETLEESSIWERASQDCQHQNMTPQERHTYMWSWRTTWRTGVYSETKVSASDHDAIKAENSWEHLFQVQGYRQSFYTHRIVSFAMKVT